MVFLFPQTLWASLGLPDQEIQVVEKLGLGWLQTLLLLWSPSEMSFQMMVYVSQSSALKLLGKSKMTNHALCCLSHGRQCVVQ